MNGTLLKLQIGPVQDFIAQARSTRDLWSGSYLLSWLMAAGAKALVEAADQGPAVVLSPTLEGQPLYDLHRGGGSPHDPDSLLTPNFTNILVADLPCEQASAATQAMVDAIRGEWSRIVLACWQKLQNAGLVAASESARFFAQAKHFPTITWQLTARPERDAVETLLRGVPLDRRLAEKIRAAASRGDLFPAQVTRNSWELDAVRALREFRSWPSRIGGSNEKDSLTGREESVVGGPACVMKASEAGELWPILFRDPDHHGAVTLVKRVWHWAYLADTHDLPATHLREPRGKEFPFPSTAHLALHDPAKNLDENTDELRDTLRAEIAAEQHTPYFAVLALDGDQMGSWLAGEKNPAGPVKEFRVNLSERLSNFALRCVRPIVEACDGRLVLAGGEDVLALLPADTAMDCARFLRLAYRGDAAFVVPLQKLAERLRQHHLHHGYEEPPDHDAKKPEMSAFLVAAARGTLFAEGSPPGSLIFNPSLAPEGSSDFRQAERLLMLPGGIERSPDVEIPDVSAGVAMAHFKEPLQDVVQAALAAEKRAKSDLNRSALAVTLVKHSGETVKWGCKWESSGPQDADKLKGFGGLELLDLIQRGRGGKIFSSRFPHRLSEVLSPYLLAPDADSKAWLQGAPGFDANLNEIIGREFDRVLERQAGSASADERKKFLDDHKPRAVLDQFLKHLGKADGQAKLRAVIGLCQVAAFIEPAVYSPTFIPPKGNA